MFAMWPFESQPVEVETAPPLGPAQHYRESQTRLAAAKHELADATKVRACYNSEHHDLRTARLDGHRATCVNAMFMYPELQNIERDWREKHWQFTATQVEFKEAKKAAGLATY